MQLHAADTGKLVRSLKLNSPAGALAFSPNGKMLAALCWNGDVLILEPDLPKQLHKFAVQGHNPDRSGPMPDGVAFAGNEHLAVVSGSATLRARDRNERPVVVASSSKVELFDTKAWKLIRTFTAEDNQIKCVAASPDGKLLAVGCGRTNFLPGKIRVFEVQSGKLVKELD
jgi:WD40 repeat protein